ncbi:hypothetical protein [Arthrobacter globiformis]|uniref:Uncharacterized protein n=1 Tax=Arthrobacter globiformis TaxID=1665 RepID=A0A328HCK0_ARTGO|nr:hypothetical protein [Arthrobacter globiformis]RAM35871.1 hypothetical protein DBZ45_17025 [Arthrobacter globiformis]
MTAVSKWVAAGSSAAVFAGGLFLGVPTAAAAPGDAACQQAFNQYESALGAAGITQATVADLESAVDAAAAAEAAYTPLQQGVDDAEAALAAAEAQLADDEAAKDAAEEALEEAQDTGDPEAIEAAQIAYETADEARGDSRDAVELRESELNAAMVSPELIQARDALDAAVANFESLLAAVSLDEASATNLMGLFEAYLTACDPDTPGVDPVVTPPATPPVVQPVAPPVNAPGNTLASAPAGAPGSTTPSVGAALIATPAGGGNAAVATNKGLNVQTAVEAEPGVDPGLALLAGLLAAGIAVPAAVARRMRRTERARN